jgi:hypothetical protein
LSTAASNGTYARPYIQHPRSFDNAELFHVLHPGVRNERRVALEVVTYAYDAHAGGSSSGYTCRSILNDEAVGRSDPKLASRAQIALRIGFSPLHVV